MPAATTPPAELAAVRARRAAGRLVRHPVARIAVAVAVPGVLTVAYAIVDEIDYRIGSGYVAAVCLVAVVAGVRAAILSTVVAVLGMWVTVLPPADGVEFRFPETLVSVGVLAGSCAAVVAIVEQRDRQAALALVAEQRYRRLSDAGVVGVIFWELVGTVTHANDTFLELLGFTRDDLEHGRIDWKALTPPEYAEIDARKVAEMFATGFHTPYEKEYFRKDGSRVALLLGSAFFEQSTERGISFMVDISRQRALEAERAALLDAERAARAETDRINRRLDLLVRVSADLLDALEPEEVLQRLASGLVPELADTASVYVVNGSVLERVVSIHAGLPDLAAQLVGRFPIPLDAASLVVDAYRTGRLQRVDDAAAPQQHSVAADPEYRALLEQLGVRRGIAVPMRERGEVLGVLTLAVSDDERDLSGHATELVAQDIADRAATVYANARAHSAERTISSLLQQALLPEHRPEIADHDLGACYVPATVARTVGGDWWDVLPLPDGRYALMVGDVTGHGVETASIMAEVRHALRGLLHDGASPARALGAVNELLAVSRPGTFATAFVAVYDPTGRELVYCRAGHPAPILLSDDEVAHLEGVHGTMIGMTDVVWTESTVRVPRSFELLVFTDGLVEARDVDYDEGVRRLVQRVHALPGGFTAQQRAERLVAESVGSSGRDDVCLVVLSRSE